MSAKPEDHIQDLEGDGGGGGGLQVTAWGWGCAPSVHVEFFGKFCLQQGDISS